MITFIPSVIYAQVYQPPARRIVNPLLNVTLQILSGNIFISRFLPALLTLLFVIGCIYFLFIFTLGAIQWINSGGDKVKLEQARDRVTQAVIGLGVLLSVYGVLSLLEYFFGTNLRSFNTNSIRI
ncbi:hypothetical protein A2962_01575 [Candidatus Woesebacteria bacterium RIFCSPLOWO2_01_FULL_39_61]|uniref:Uncharacterized protein n=1 Tax=Candidatus Woesebacteria bacterium RIFCSPHIGHO2_02_FULL_39_13 TaxID=1802505 RepID=A0A1F7Z4Y2_9BACT|nr:MAG: hypothetical protein A2692_01815 [Candidatus Woesebacteria bacterium RIFCSPHIGHO2_01_FULL_39_95]OGM34534.1 MAG: hypothetical protein A3D01_03265 [Candidatus Woesebacteria bacterium RIFCSPHIGHO2_02_FULL_39_13]OGM38801.1 MAG: hypothetical protein A3E13_01160 [Candidatus Woesebacteria bacterium RIFCSPHIGHO2_12_FULL_40_20]OGM65807.1 MAG: hypothetical protein A2962_01575 [Candidatus Woesebacteria bacterium RIFCSPLOWO2_01_FULL_39_61]OGM71621.1 MAG: hypothetical protein A3H19_04870 [Candidatus